MPSPVFETPDAAERAFYQAFAHADLEAMMRVWADDRAVVCVHPSGLRLHGREEVERGWREMFLAGAPMRFEIVQGQRMRGGALAVHSVLENIHHGPRLSQRARTVATNVYRKFDEGWRMVLHHASMAETEAEHTPEAEPGGPEFLH